ncbi:MAG TPA: septal ring lytic transglycosylase RlpA family protein [Burkholderiaceae bacterium]|nr:septal ring lytic transglycosylase RlpA family protein [Burkholderiaceae bacterium]
MLRLLLIVLSCVVLLGGCASKRQVSKGGGYYKDDGPGSHIPANIAAIPNATPRLETPRPANARPYKVLGRRYVPLTSHQAYRKTGIASWYGRKFHGKKTASGEIYDMYAMTAAHRTLPIPSYARVTRVGTDKSIIVRINDRGPFHQSRIIDLSYVAAAKLDLIGPGSGKVMVEAITNDAIKNNAWQPDAAPAPKARPIPPAPPAPAPTLITKAGPTSPPSPPSADSSEPTDALQALQLPVALAKSDIPAARPLDSSGVFLQYGAFSDHSNANKLAQRLNQDINHIESRTAEIIQHAALYRVRIGPYANRTQAVNAALRIEGATGLKATYRAADSDRSSASL